MVFSGKVEIVEKHETLALRTIDRAYQLPTVVRLDRYIKSPRRKVLLNRRNLLQRDNHRCQYCGKPENACGKLGLTIDHIKPKRSGGGYTWENLVCACVSCNSKKGHRTPEQANMKLLRKPRRPSRITFIRQSASNAAAHSSWRPYLFMD